MYEFKTFKGKKLFIALLMPLAIILNCNLLFAQSSLNAAGGDASSGTGSVSYSIGQLFVSSNSGSGYTSNEGVQQPYEILVSVEEEVDNPQFECNAFPNPAKNYLIIETNINNNISFELFDLNGRLLKREDIRSNITKLNIVDLKPSVYYLRIKNSSEIIKSFKIIKD